jgi:hypothetical protein
MAIPPPHLFLYLFFDFSQVDKNNTKTSGDKIIRTKNFFIIQYKPRHWLQSKW